MLLSAFGKSIEETLQKEIKARIDNIMEEEAKKAEYQVKKRLHSLADELALSVLKLYSVQDSRDCIVITVNKEKTK